jgi:multiple sugar transport system ATP-binding protein
LCIADSKKIDTSIASASLPKDKTFTFGIRPEDVSIAIAGSHTKGKVAIVERLGERTLVHVKLSNGLNVTAEAEGKSSVKIGDVVPLVFNGKAAHLFDASGLTYSGAK